MAPRHRLRKKTKNPPQVQQPQSPSSRLRALGAEIKSEYIADASIEVLLNQKTFLADTALVLLAATRIEGALEVAILAKMRPLNSTERKGLFEYTHNGPLCDFDARIKIAYALGVFGSKTRDDLFAIKAVRNHFAHPKAHWSLDHKEIAAICDSLHIHGTITILGTNLDRSTPRGRFMAACQTISSRLKFNIENLAPPSLSNLARSMVYDRLLP